MPSSCSTGTLGVSQKREWITMTFGQRSRAARSPERQESLVPARIVSAVVAIAATVVVLLVWHPWG